MKLKGKVVKQPVGVEVYILEADDGVRYAIKGGDAALRQDGIQVSVEGEVQQAVGIGMTGDPVLAITSYSIQS